MFFEFLADYGLFFAKTATFVIAVLIIIGAIFANAQRGNQTKEEKKQLEVKKVNERLEHMQKALQSKVLDSADLKILEKERKQKQKEEKKQAKQNAKDKSKSSEQNKHVYVLDFVGDIKASQVDDFRDEITAVLTLANSNDEVVVRLESQGGMVHAYGLAASQLARFKVAKVPLTICVDKVAASGGYMMACIADKLLAAPFAILGSIGVVASLPNFNKIMKKNDIDYEMLTAGEYKRTLTMLGENTEEGRKKFIQDLEETHELFKKFVVDYRPQLTISEVATGETWYGQKAVDNLLIDSISTSDQYITELAKDFPVYEVKYTQKKNWQEKLGVAVENGVQKSFLNTWQQLLNSWNTRH